MSGRGAGPWHLNSHFWQNFYSILREAGACPNLLSPTHTSFIEEAEYRDQGNNFPITEAVKLWLNLWLGGPLGGWGSA